MDYDSIENATKALRAHQGWKWEPVDEGLKIDYDQAGGGSWKQGCPQ